MMRIIPVLDVKGGVVVRGIAGRREDYRPIVSRLTKSCRPVDVARAFRDQLGFQEMYLADLDAIAGERPALETYSEIRALGCQLWVDAGVRSPKQAGVLAAAGIEKVVLGLETISGPIALRNSLWRLGEERTVFSLDLKGGKPAAEAQSWKTPSILSLVSQAIGFGVRRVIVLDLSRVGTGEGPGTEKLCRFLTTNYPQVELTAGGGVRGIEDLERLRKCRVSSVLVSSALHDGQLRPKDWEGL